MELVADHDISVENVTNQPLEFGDFKRVVFCIKDRRWPIFISDEYDEYRNDRPLLGVYMALDALQEYHQSRDYLDWCKTFEVAPETEELRTYYIGLEVTHREIREHIGEVEPILKEIRFQFPWRDADDAWALLEN